jgi:hypothetical protein
LRKAISGAEDSKNRGKLKGAISLAEKASKKANPRDAEKLKALADVLRQAEI